MNELIKRNAPILALACALFVGGCSGDSSLPSATGKAAIRAINAIETSPDLNFLIEQRLISPVPFKGVSAFAEYDDLEYDFNFDVFFPGDTAVTRIATQHLDVTADQDYTLLVTGSIAAPVITVWEAAENAADANATVFRVRFANTATSMATVDYYFAAQGVAPVLGEQVATLSLAEISDPVDLAAGDYAVTITTAGDPTNVLYTSSVATFAAQSDFIITLFDGDADDTAPLIVRAIGTNGAVFSMIDTSFAATVEFLHGSMALGTSDIYNDETLLSQLVAGHSFRGVSAEIPVASGDQTFRYTPAGDTAVITFESTTTMTAGLRYRVTALGEAGSFITTTSIPDRRPIETAAKVLTFQTSANFDFLTFYFVPPGETIDASLLIHSNVATGQASQALTIAAGSFDILVTENNQTAILAGPVRIDVAVGDVVDLVVFDTVDPALLDLQIIAGP